MRSRMPKKKKSFFNLCSQIRFSGIRNSGFHPRRNWATAASALIDKTNNNHAFTYLNSPRSPKRENSLNNCEAKLSLCGFLGVVDWANRMSLTRFKRPWGWSLLVLFGNLRLLTSITIYWPRFYIASHYPDLRGIVFGNALWNFPTAKPLKCACFTPYPQRQAGRQTASLLAKVYRASLIAIRAKSN